MLRGAGQRQNVRVVEPAEPADEGERQGKGQCRCRSVAMWQRHGSGSMIPTLTVAASPTPGHQYIDVTRKPVFLKWLAHFPTMGE